MPKVTRRVEAGTATKVTVAANSTTKKNGATIWVVKNGEQDSLLKNILAGESYVLGPYINTVDVRIETFGDVTVHRVADDFKEPVTLASLLNTGTVTAAANTDVMLRGVRIADASTSLLGFNQSPYAYLVSRNGDLVQRILNGGLSGQQAKNIANTFHTNTVNQDPAIVLVCPASNDFLSGSPTDTPVAGTGTIANAKFYIKRIIEQALARGIRVALLTEPYRQLPQVVSNANVIYWNTVYLPELVAFYNTPNVILIDIQAEVVNTSTGVPLIPIITQASTGTSGQSTITVADATGITRGMYAACLSGKMVAAALMNKVTNIAGNVITFDGTLNANLSENVYFYVDYYDNVHPSPVGARKQGDKIYTDLVAAGWLPKYGSTKPLTELTAAASSDNLFSNGTLEGGQSGGIATGYATNYSGTKQVTTHPDFIGNVQVATLVPGEAGGKYFLMPSADVSGKHNRWAVVSIKINFSGIQPNGAIISVLGQFDKTPAAIPGTFTTEGAQPVYWDNISICDGTYVFHARVKVPAGASTFNWNITNNLAFPAGATSNGVVTVGEVVCMDNDHPLEDAELRNPTRLVASFNVPSLTAFDGYVGIDATNASRTPALPAAALWDGKIIYVEKTDASVNTVAVSGAAKGTITLSTQYSIAAFMSSGGSIRHLFTTTV